MVIPNEIMKRYDRKIVWQDYRNILDDIEASIVPCFKISKSGTIRPHSNMKALDACEKKSPIHDGSCVSV